MLDSYETWKLLQKAFGLERKEMVYKKEMFLETLVKTPDDFMTFLSRAKRQSDNGAIVIFTDKQYVFRVNDGQGTQGHLSSFARTYFAIKGRYPSHLSLDDTQDAVSDLERRFLRITFEAERWARRDDYWHITVKVPYVISNGELASFELFYQTFGEVIQKYPFQYTVIHEARNNFGYKMLEKVMNIDELYNFLKSVVSDDKEEVAIEEDIVGVDNEYHPKSK